MKKKTLLYLGVGVLLLLAFRKKKPKGSLIIPDIITQTETEFEADRKMVQDSAATPIAALIKQAVSFVTAKKLKKKTTLPVKKIVVQKKKQVSVIKPPVFSLQNFK